MNGSVELEVALFLGFMDGLEKIAKEKRHDSVRAAANGALVGNLLAGPIGAPIGAAIGARSGKKARSAGYAALGSLLGNVGGRMAGGVLGPGGAIVGQLAAGSYGAYKGAKHGAK